MKILLATLGSRGDVQPPLALAVTLKARGHEVTLVAPPDFTSWIESFGVAAVPLGLDFQKWAQARREELKSNRRVLQEILALLQENVADEFRVLEPLVRGADLVVTSSLVTAGPSLAAAHKKPYLQFAFVPTILPTPAHAPFFVPARNLPTTINRALWALTHRGFDRPIKAALNAARDARGLSPIDHVIAHLVAEEVLLAADAALVPPFESAMRLTQVPAVTLDDTAALSAEVNAFLESGPPPVYVGFGSMPDPEPARMAEMIRAAVATVGCRAIIARGWADLDDAGPADDTVYFSGPEPHGALFRRCAAVVHHGGAGTTTTALHAGVPQAIVPYAVDQPDWADRVAKAGLGPRGLPRARVRPDRLASQIARCLDDDEMRAKAARVADEIAAGPGNAAAADVVERVAREGRAR